MGDDEMYIDKSVSAAFDTAAEHVIILISDILKNTPEANRGMAAAAVATALASAAGTLGRIGISSLDPESASLIKDTLLSAITTGFEHGAGYAFTKANEDEGAADAH